VERVAIFAALQWECRSVLRHLRQVRRDRVGMFTRWCGRAPRGEVWVVKTGVGIERAAAALDALGDCAGFALLMSTGCAGALAADLQPGDLVLSRTVVSDATSGGHPTDAALRAGARRAIAAAGLRAVEGAVLCSPVALTSAAAKRTAAVGEAIAVEMEAEAIASRAAEAGVPFLSVRAIIDGAEHELRVPPTLIDPATGVVRPLALAGYLAAHPHGIGELLFLQRLQRAARDSLERFFAVWLARTDGDG